MVAGLVIGLGIKDGITETTTHITIFEQKKEKNAGNNHLPDETETRPGKKDQDSTDTENNKCQNVPGAFF